MVLGKPLRKGQSKDCEKISRGKLWERSVVVTVGMVVVGGVVSLGSMKGGEDMKNEEFSSVAGLLPQFTVLW
jgi:hypothetical protein